MNLDDKQKRLIEAWLKRAVGRDGDEYGKFMAGWIAFNAFCYALYAQEASRARPDLRDDRGLTNLTGRVSAAGSVELRADGRVRIELVKPGRIQIDIRERYTEDIVFAQFARAFQSKFIDWLNDGSFQNARDEFLTSLTRPKGCYVLNMLRADKYNEESTFKELKTAHIIVAVEKPDNLAQIVDALYQIRCNVFHGEKVPGAFNDDRIVKAARPLLLELLQRALATHLTPR